MQKRPKGKHGVEIVLHQTELIQLQVLDCSLLVLKVEIKINKQYEKIRKIRKNSEKIPGGFQIEK